MSRLGRLFRRGRLERHLDAELTDHLERQVADYRSAGLSEDEARRQASLAFGSTESVKEACRDARGTRWLEDAAVDVREAKDVDAAKRGEILFYRDPDLAPGLYTMETIVFDAGARQGSARIATLTVPGAEPSAIEMSSLILASRVEEVGDASGRTRWPRCSSAAR